MYNQMVVDSLTDEQVDLLFHALADATRRDIVKRAIKGEHSVSDLAAGYEMSFAAVQKHVAVLERAGLVTKTRRGRERLVRTDIATVNQASELLDKIEELWRSRVNTMSELLALDPGETQ
jgi:DNA-binding transcriptional ArsR family regulator